MRPVTIQPSNVSASLIEIQTASHENDIVDLAQSFSADYIPSFLAPSVQTFQAGNPASTAETTLASFTLPANSLTKINQGIKISAAGYWGNNGTDATIRLYFGSSVFVLDNAVSDHARWYAEMTVILVAEGPTQEFITAWAATDFGVGPFGDDPTIDVTSDVTIKVTGQSPVAGVANEANAYQLIVEPIGSDIASAASVFAQFLAACQKGGVNRTT